MTGYGPARSRRQAAALAGEEFGALAVAGVGGGLTDDLVPGDLVVATEVRDARGTSVRCPAAPLLAGELRRAGLRAHAGPVVTVDRLAGGASRQRLAASGALVADLESAPLAAAAGGRPLAVLRAVSDTPARPLLQPGDRDRRAGRAAGAAGRQPGAGRLGRRGRAAPGAAGRPAVVLRRGGAGHRDRREGARPARGAGVRAQADRAQHARRGRPGTARCGVRGRTVRGPGRGVRGLLRARGVPGRPRGGRPARPGRRRRDLPAGGEGARGGAPVRGRRLPGGAHRARRPRGGRGHAGRGAGVDGPGGEPPPTWPGCAPRTRARSPT